MTTSHPLPPKKEVALALLERSNDRGIFVHLDPRQASVVVPPWFKKLPQLVLQIGLNMPVPIPDLRLDDDGLSCTLSFNRSPFFCAVPWASVFAMVGEDGRGMVWPDDVPAEVPLSRQAPTPSAAPVRAVEDVSRRETPADKADKAAGKTPKGRKPRKRAPLTAVPDAAPEVEAAAPRKVRPARAAKTPAPPQRPTATAAKRPTTPTAPSPTPSSAGAAAAKGAGVGNPASSGAGNKKKRELPPYLRVVK